MRKDEDFLPRRCSGNIGSMRFNRQSLPDWALKKPGALGNSKPSYWSKAFEPNKNLWLLIMRGISRH